MLKTSVLFLLIVSSAAGEVFTSSEKMKRLAGRELTLLNQLRSYKKDTLPEEIAERFQTFQTMSKKRFMEKSLHPNGAYLLIKAFVYVWPSIITSDPELWKHYASDTAEFPSQKDIEGSLSAILRLQRVYRLTVVDVYTGNFSGYTGPSLDPDDAYQLGRQAFMDGLLRESISWLELAVAEYRRAVRARLIPDSSDKTGTKGMLSDGNASQEEPMAALGEEQKAAILGLLGRAHLHAGHVEKATNLYQEAARLSKEKIRRHHRCCYRRSLSSPYIRYKQEILSLVPYISIFYDVITGSTIKTVKEYILGKMVRGKVQNRQGKDFVTSHERISEMGWVHDSDWNTAALMSQRVKDITWLEVEEHPPDGPSSGEGFQIINYGLGGHHNSHYDPVKVIKTKELEHSGNRLATFIFYLSDVEIGGHTVFLKSGISVSPVKGMALLWYNYNPAMRLERLTLHAGCPVLKGHKWIANKWIWTYGNTFRRPCGDTPRSTQVYVERRYMMPLTEH